MQVRIDYFNQLLIVELLVHLDLQALRRVLQHVFVLKHKLASRTKHFENHQDFLDFTVDRLWIEFAITIFLRARPNHLRLSAILAE